MWTVYRLQDQRGRPAPLPLKADDYADTLTPLLGELGYLGIFDGEPALFLGVGTLYAFRARPSGHRPALL